MLICQKCLTKFADKLIKSGKNMCPVLGCGGNIIDVPNNLAEAVILFNEKGYVTKFVSTGNCDGTPEFQLYIAFERIHKDEAKNSLYNKWKLPEGLEMKFSLMRMSHIKSDDENYVSPRISICEQDFTGLDRTEIIKKKFHIIDDASSKILDFANSVPLNKQW